MFAYSMRDRTHASYKLQDDVPEEVKLRRLQEVGVSLACTARVVC